MTPYKGILRLTHKPTGIQVTIHLRSRDSLSEKKKQGLSLLKSRVWASTSWEIARDDGTITVEEIDPNADSGNPS